jgi:glycolate oxidase FAD binding subunit
LPSVSEPASVEEAAALLAEASRAGNRVSIEREGGEVVLSTRRLDRILEHAAGDLTATVEAGVRLSQLQSALAEHGQMLALDPPGDPTIGACLAGNLSGPRRHRYGTARDLVLGVTVVLADGTVANSGGKVVKNVAGYDLGKLFCGSRGTLGLIARVSLRLHPRPRVARTLVAEVDQPSEAQRLAREVHRSAIVPSALDLLWPGRLALLLEGNEAAASVQVETAVRLIGGGEDDASVWREIAARQQQARGRLSFPPGELARTLEGLPEAVVRVGHGVAHVPEAVDGTDEAVRRLNERIRREFDPQETLVQAP